MKTNLYYLFIGVFFHLPNFLLSQSTIDFPKDNASWQEGFYFANNMIAPEYRVLCGDTTISGNTYSKIYQLTYDNQGQEANRIYEGGLREAGDRVYWMQSFTSDEILLYDWGLESTEQITLKTVLGTENTITAGSNQVMTTPDGVFRRVIVFAPQAGAPEEVWVEGIGSNLGILARGTNQNENPDYRPFLNCYRFEQEIILESDNAPLNCDFIFNENCLLTSLNETIKLKEVNFKIFPNPFQRQTQIQIENFELLKTPILSIYNMQGQIIHQINVNEKLLEISLEENISQGIYFFELTASDLSFSQRRKVVVGF